MRASMLHNYDIYRMFSNLLDMQEKLSNRAISVAVCEDYVTYCDQYSYDCHNSAYANFFRTNCMMTCGFCASSKYSHIQYSIVFTYASRVRLRRYYSAPVVAIWHHKAP